jgi:hypothetical protein
VSGSVPLRFTDEHRVPPLSLNVTAPVGVPAPGATAATVAVKVTCWPVTGFAGEEVAVVVVGAGSTTSSSAVDAEPALFVSPPYVATTSSSDVAWA